MLGYDFRNGAQLSYPMSHQPYVYTLAYRLRNQRRGLGLTKGNGYTPDKKGKVIKICEPVETSTVVISILIQSGSLQVFNAWERADPLDGRRRYGRSNRSSQVKCSFANQGLLDEGHGSLAPVPWLESSGAICWAGKWFREGDSKAMCIQQSFRGDFLGFSSPGNGGFLWAGARHGDQHVYLLWMSCSHTCRATALTMAWDCRSPWMGRKYIPQTRPCVQPYGWGIADLTHGSQDSRLLVAGRANFCC